MIKIDGVDHINAYSKGKTALGRFLTHFYKHPVHTQQYGSFASIENLWQWLNYEREELRDCEPHMAKMIPKRKKYYKLRTSPYTVAACRQIIIQAHIQKLKENPEMAELFVNNALPVVHYYDGNTQKLDKQFAELLKEVKEKYIESMDSTTKKA